MNLQQRTISPIDGSTYVRREFASPAQIERALAAATTAQRAWRTTPLEERVDVVLRMVDIMVADADAIGLELAWQMGRPIAYGPKEITGGFAERARAMAALAPDVLADQDVGGATGATRLLRSVPVGVVLVLAPWNYPFLTAVNAVVPALLAGNAVLLKHSDQTPLAGERFQSAFEAAGLPTGVLQNLVMSHETVAEVVQDARVGYVHFTGSVEGGHAVKRAAAGRFIEVGLELGGKDPAYVREDADLDMAAVGLADGVYFNSGQSCCGVERIYVHQDSFDAFVERFLEQAKALRLGDPRDAATTLGPLARRSNAERVRERVRAAIAHGAVPLLDARDFPAEAPGTAYLAPQVLLNVRQRMPIMHDETFGPVVGIMPVAGDDEAQAAMNDSRYGLTASVWSRDVDAALRFGSDLEVGTVYANRCDYLDPLLAWTGVKDSGRGVSLSRLGFGPFTRPMSFLLQDPS